MDTATFELPLLQNFPVDGPRKVRGAPRYLRSRRNIAPATLRRFDAFCQSVDADTFAGLHAVFSLLLMRCSGETDVHVATRLPGATDFSASLAHAARGEGFTALLSKSRDATRTDPSASREVDGRSVAPLPSLLVDLVQRDWPDGPPPSEREGDLSLHASYEASGLVLEWVHADDVLQAATVDRMARRFDVLLEAVLAHPDDDAWCLPFMDDAEQDTVLHAWNATIRPWQDCTLHELFASQVLRTPDAIALTWRDERLTYAELDRRANRLAHTLRAQGVGAQGLVAVCLERSPSMLVALLGILKAGGAYVPVDPNYPPERLDFMVSDSGAAWVVAQASTLERVSAPVCRIVLDDPTWMAALASCPTTDPASIPGQGSDALAYIIYTSGSTGRPKGVCIEHRQAAAFVAWAREVFDADALAGVLAATSICFDLSVFELFVTLACGGRIVLVDSPLDFEGIARAEGLTLINTVPSAIKALLDESAIPSTVRIVNLAGEPLPEALVRDIYRQTGADAVYNLYGPSEDTTYSTYALIERDRPGPPSIGAPISNGQAYVLDRYLDPVPVGVVGEVYVGGAGVARGYWNRAALTAERFIPDPFHPREGARLYKTGDLARWSADGQLHYLGRVDFQVKLRGLRIELGEIQARLLAMELVDDAVVTVYEDARGEKQLVAYLVSTVPAMSLDDLSAACRSELAGHLPEYMIPAVFVPLDALPQTPNGKIDRSALPPPPTATLAAYVEPPTDLQRRLAQAWQDILQLPSAVGMQSNFFDLGGNSILAMRLLARIRLEHGTEVTAKSLFLSGTLDEFARAVALGAEATSPPLVRAPTGESVPLSFVQQGLWLVDQLGGGSAQYHVQLRFLIEGALDGGALRRAVDAVMQRHESLRTVIVFHDQHPVQRVRDDIVVPFLDIDLSDVSPDAKDAGLERIVHEDAMAPFALDSDAMLRGILVRMAPARHELLLTMHHVAMDGWSIDVLVSDLAALYEAERLGTAAALPPLPLHYSDYAIWQRDWLQPEALEHEATYWLDRLADLPDAHRLPLDRPRPEQQDMAAGVLRTHVDPAAARALAELARQERATPFIGLHAVFALLMARESGDDDIVVGTPVANRSHAELASMIGLFTNTVVLRSRVSATATFLDILQQSRQAILDGYAHQHVPFNCLVERLQPRRSLSHMPLFQVMLSLQDTGRTPLRLPGLTVTTQPVRPELALVELTLEVTETGDGLVLDWIYRKALFDASTIERLAADFDALLHHAVAEPRRNVWDLPGAKGDVRVRTRPPVPVEQDVATGMGHSDPLPATALNATESALHAVWARLFQQGSVDPDLNFFAAGGNSLLLMRMIHAVHERLGVRIGVKDVFQHPTIRRLAAALPRAVATDDPLPATTRSSGKGGLSLSQFRIWYLEQLRPGNEHNIPFVVALRGKVDRDILERALNRLIARHDMFRAGFALESDAPVQVVEPSVVLALDYRDLADLDPAQLEASMHILAVGHATRRFDIRRAPLVRAMLLRVADTDYRLHLNFHHLVFDGWSFAIFLDELLVVMEALARDAEPVLDALPHGYLDFVAWQDRWLASEAAVADAAFWRTYLDGCPQQLALPRQHDWPSASAEAAGRHVACLSPHTRERLDGIARERGGTLFSVLYSAFALLLGRLADQQDVVIGIPVSGRHVGSTQGVIGNFLNNLPMRTHWRADQPFADYLAAQIGNVEQVLSHQDYPFEKILEQVPHMRGSEASPVFQAFFNMQSVPREVRPRLFDAERLEAAEIEPKFDLTVYVEDDGSEVTLTCHGREAVFSSAAMANLLGQYLVLLDQVAVEPRLPCGAYSLRFVPPGHTDHRAEPQAFWSGSVHALFRQRALDHPEAPAIVEHGQSWSYGELLGASNQLARRLQSDGVGPGDIVAIVAARQATLVVGVMAVLQSGAAFSLLNPEYPIDRVAQLVDIVAPACILFAGEAERFPAALVARLADRAPCRFLPSSRPTDGDLDHDFVPVTVEAQQLACVTFTSGTTGVPKAVAGTHAGLAGYLGWVPEWLQLSPFDRFSLLSGLGHDPLQREIFTPLCIGATLLVPDPESISPYRLAEWLVGNAITFAHLTPAMSEVLCTTDIGGFPSLRVAFVTGDKLSSATVSKLLGHNSAMRVLNSYGTTETQRATTYFDIAGARLAGGLVPVSESSPDTVIRVMNAMGTECGLGETGDLFVESHALSRGYLNDPELTAKVFTPLDEGRRRYRTGDVGYRQPDGTIRVLGRKDGQVKIRGFRIELGEIDAHVRSRQTVKDAVVLPMAGPGAEPALVVYAVPAPGVTDRDAWRTDVLAYLKTALPAYMLPAQVVALDSLPLTPNGKLDARALPAPVWEPASSSAPPRNDMEQAIASVWAEILGLERVGVDDDFFELGGHSMLLVLLLNRIRERLDLRGNITRILSCSTVAEQARALSSMQSGNRA